MSASLAGLRMDRSATPRRLLVYPIIVGHIPVCLILPCGLIIIPILARLYATRNRRRVSSHGGRGLWGTCGVTYTSYKARAGGAFLEVRPSIMMQTTILMPQSPWIQLSIPVRLKSIWLILTLHVLGD
jgi:hypothetical protein